MSFMDLSENLDRQAAIEADEAAKSSESDDQEELQLREDERGPISRKRHRHNDAAKKLEAITWSKKISINSAAKKFDVSRGVIQDWRKHERAIQQQFNTARGSKRKRLEGGGRPVLEPELDSELAEWIREMRESKKPVSRSIIKMKAIEVFRGNDIKISNGWLEKFLNRNNFVLRRRTTTCQRAPENFAEVVAKFIVHVEKLRKEKEFSLTYAMDETAVWFDCPDNRCIETKGAQDVSVITTGHEKMRLTVCLTARSDGKKLMPYVLVKRKRPVPSIVSQFKGKLVINWAGSTWMNDLTTEDYLRQVIRSGGVFAKKRLLVWDAFASHKSQATTAVLKELGIETALIPGGCTKFIQAPDVCWNKPFKEKIRQYYTIWMNNDDRRKFTAAGNPKAPSLEVVLDWVDRAWQELSKEMIVNSFKCCALTTATDGSEDSHIVCFKPNGSIGERGLKLVRDFRLQNLAEDGSEDFEEAGIEEDDELNLEDISDNEEVLFDD